MSASHPIVDRRPIAAVAIIGNDAVLAAAPATPVQLAHACLRRGFTVAVPASWGDELIAADALRRLATRERGPAVMCVCPFVRSRLLAPGPDLAPFLVSLVSPPVATARYLRTVYGDRGVHITYIGSCPSADDPTIDSRLTPDAFLADIAEHGIALSEQPLVFDSIVPPDRRRWCSLPGGAPSPEILWSDTDTRTLVEIERDDISTDLAQHIITREHVLLDLAPSLGCVCSGAVTSLPPRSARVAVTALEPPRAPRPVIEVLAGMSLDVPVPQPEVYPTADALAVPMASAPTKLPEHVLDEMLGTAVDPSAATIELEAELDAELIEALTTVDAHESALGADASDPMPEPEQETPSPAEVHAAFSSPRLGLSDVTVQTEVLVASHVFVEPEASVEPLVRQDAVIRIDPEMTVPAMQMPADVMAPPPPRRPEVVVPIERAAPPNPPTAATVAPVRRRTPASLPSRHPASSIPKATSSDGRALPRAYVGKRRTPTTTVAIANESVPPVDAVQAPAPNAQREARAEPTPPSPPTPARPSPVAKAETAIATATTAEVPKVNAPSPTTEGPGNPPVETTRRSERKAAPGAVAAPESNPSAIIILLIGLLALGFFVLRSLS